MAEYPKAWVDYLIYFHTDQDFFECHEVLEEHWKREGMKGGGWPGLIQVAVALYHQRRNNYNGAFRMINSAINKLQDEDEFLRRIGIDSDPFIGLLKKRMQVIKEHRKYEPLYLPLTPSLLNQCHMEAKKRGKVWGQAADFSPAIVDKHKLRDRSSVIKERISQKQLKNRSL
jgi:uncharacterized protein